MFYSGDGYIKNNKKNDKYCNINKFSKSLSTIVIIFLMIHDYLSW